MSNDSALCVRPANAEDAGAIATVFSRSLRTLTFLPELHSVDEDRAFIRRLIDFNEVWLAAIEERCVGFLSLSQDGLEHLYVDPDIHGRGIGSALLDKAKEQRPEGFTLWVFQQNTRARRFYEARACRVVRLTDGRDNEERCPDALLEWRP